MTEPDRCDHSNDPWYAKMILALPAFINSVGTGNVIALVGVGIISYLLWSVTPPLAKFLDTSHQEMPKQTELLRQTTACQKELCDTVTKNQDTMIRNMDDHHKEVMATLHQNFRTPYTIVSPPPPEQRPKSTGHK